MCNPAAAVAVASIGASLYGMKRQRDARQNAMQAQQEAQERAIQQRNERIAMANAAMEKQNQMRMAAMQAQTDIANRSSDAFRQAAQDQLGNLDRDISEEESRQRQSLNQVIDRDVAGEAGRTRQVGSDVKGRVSEDFTERGQQAGAENESRARRFADQLATIGAFRQVPVQRGQQMSAIGQAIQPFQRERQNRAAMDRLRIQQAGRLPTPKPDEPTEYIDPTDPLGQALVGIGQGGLDLYGAGFFDQPAQTTSGLSQAGAKKILTSNAAYSGRG